MKRRVIAAIMAILLAAVGGVVLLTYVGAADKRAMAGMETVNVLVVSKLIPEGTPAEKLGELVATKTLPAKAVASGALSDLKQISGRITTTALQPGEQIFASRFIDPKSLEKSDELKIPKGMSQVSILLDSQRVLGGYLTAGSTVGLYISLPEKDPVPGQTRLVLNKVLVSRVQGGLTAAPAPQKEGEPPATQAPLAQGSVMVTLVLTARDAEKVVFAAENGTIWLSMEPADADLSGTRVVTRENVYKK